MKNTLFLTCVTLAFTFSAQATTEGTLSAVVRKSPVSERFCPESKDGEVCLMTWQQALNFCQEQDSHLPIAREYAKLVVSRGTQILEPDQVAAGVPPGFYLVDSVNADGTLDRFYMNHSTYQRPATETEFYLLWTASTPPQHPAYAHVYYNEWGGGGGDPKHHLKDYRNAVQCVTNR